jgi:hypothetical protein
LRGLKPPSISVIPDTFLRRSISPIIAKINAFIAALIAEIKSREAG